MRIEVKHLLFLKNRNPIKRFAIIVFILYIGFSLISSIWAVYLKSFLDKEAFVGLVSSLFIIISFASNFLIIPLIESKDKYKLLVGSLLMLALGYLSYYFIKDFYLFLLVACVMTVVSAIRISSTGLLIRENSSRRNLSKNEGFIYTFFNVAFLIGPIIASIFLASFGLRQIFLLSPIILLLSVFLLKISRISHGKKKKRIDKNVFKNFSAFFKHKGSFRAYLFRAGISFWWSLVYIYIPLLIIKQLENFWVGVFIASVTIPLILFEYKFGRIAGKKGYKKLFFLGFLIPAIISILCFFLFDDITVVLPLIVLASIGLSMIESNTESYFFDIIKGKEDQRYYSPYNTSIDFGSFVGQAIPSIILFILPFNYIFLVYFVGMCFLSFLSLSVKKIIEQKRKGK